MRFFAPAQIGPGAHPAYCTMGTGSFPGLKRGRGVRLNPHPFLEPFGYGLDGKGIESRWGRNFSHLTRPALGSTQPAVQWVPGLSRG